MSTENEDSSEPIEVRVGKVPGEVKTVVLNGSRTVRTAFEAIGFDADGLVSDGFQFRVRGDNVDSGYELDEGDTILALKKIKGNG